MSPSAQLIAAAAAPAIARLKAEGMITTTPAKAPTNHRFTPAESAAHSLRMRQVWAERRAGLRPALKTIQRNIAAAWLDSGPHPRGAIKAYARAHGLDPFALYRAVARLKAKRAQLPAPSSQLPASA